MTPPHPIPYQGSKRSLANAILNFFPINTLRLVEPFCGSAAISIAAATHCKAESFVLNDANSALMRLWDLIINDPSSIASKYRGLWEAQEGLEKEYFFQIRTEFNEEEQPELLLFLLTRCVKASVRYNALGKFNQSADNRRKGTHPDTMEKNILEASRLLKGKSKLFRLDYRGLLPKLGGSDLVYMDPPYQGVCGNRDNRYLGNIDFDEFMDFLEQMNNRSISFILSYDGRMGDKAYGSDLPCRLELKRIEIEAGRSSQATLLGRKDRTIESLYLSPTLASRLNCIPARISHKSPGQLSLVWD